jgi:epoxyqueuosine reductase QueG
MPSTGPTEMGLETRGLVADFSYRHAAVAAGLGELGWNQLVITPQFGPRVWLMAVITNADLAPDPLYDGPKLCLEDECNLCIDNCPQSALTAGAPTDKPKCLRAYGQYGLYGLIKHLKNIMEEPDAEKRKDLVLGQMTWELWQHIQYGGGPTQCKACIKLCPVGYKMNTDA